ncbi:hypothetical protein [Thioclava sp. F28-4]|uniref:hypothetical protein n=1 Tax=Thioclava sp. F28-4 TaxID=1915315 RepID=UPI0011BAAA29|nr:hypothetical protein [Thioclava sp. F28-4]
MQVSNHMRRRIEAVITRTDRLDDYVCEALYKPGISSALASAASASLMRDIREKIVLIEELTADESHEACRGMVEELIEPIETLMREAGLK